MAGFLKFASETYVHDPLVHGARWGSVHLSCCVFVSPLFVRVLFGMGGRFHS